MENLLAEVDGPLALAANDPSVLALRQALEVLQTAAVQLRNRAIELAEGEDADILDDIQVSELS